LLEIFVFEIGSCFSESQFDFAYFSVVKEPEISLIFSSKFAINV
jgi:hypothetical protein